MQGKSRKWFTSMGLSGFIHMLMQSAIKFFSAFQGLTTEIPQTNGQQRCNFQLIYKHMNSILNKDLNISDEDSPFYVSKQLL